MLELVGLADEARRHPHELSGGQQQRVALARALAPRPRLVLLDEPFSNLDADVRMELAQQVRAALVAEGATALLVTHDQREAFAIADEIGVMRAGRLEQWDAPWTLYHSPATRFVADFVGEGTFIQGTVLGPGRVSTELGVIEGQLTSVQPAGTLVDLLLRPDDVIHDDGARCAPRSSSALSAARSSGTSCGCRRARWCCRSCRATMTTRSASASASGSTRSTSSASRAAERAH